MTVHVIQRLCFEVDVSTTGAAEALQDRLSQFEQELLRPLLEEVFQSLFTMPSLSKLSLETTQIRWDRIELDLGNVSHDQLENELKACIPTVLKQVLTRELQQSATVSHSPEPVTEKRVSVLKQLYHYMHHGVMHWSSTLGETPDQLLKRCLERDPHGLRLWILKEGAKVRQRLVHHFDNHLLYRLVRLLSPQQADTARAVIDDLLRIQNRWPFPVADGKIGISRSSAEINAVAWEGVIATFVQNNGDASAAEVTQSVLQSLASVLGATESDLAELLLRRARLTSGTESLRNALQVSVKTSVVNNKMSGDKSKDNLDGKSSTMADLAVPQSTELTDLLHLLRYGVLPTFGGQLPRLSIEAWIGELLKLRKKELLDALRPLAHRHDQLRRLLNFLPRCSLEQLILAFAGNYGGFVLTYLLIIDRAVDGGRLPSEAKDLMWFLFIGRLLDPDRSPVTPAEVAGDLNYRAARLLGVSELEFLAILYKTLLSASDSRFKPMMELVTQRIKELDDDTLIENVDDSDVRENLEKRKQGRVILSNSTSRIIYFLKFGNLPDGEIGDAAWSLDAALDQAQRSNAIELRDQLLAALRDSVMLQRLVLHVSEERTCRDHKTNTSTRRCQPSGAASQLT